MNLATKRCGYCVGRFVLLVNKRKKTSNGQSEKQLTTPRPPSAFALFVKENYSIVKQSNSNLKHAEVMKYLGQKFAALKVPATDNSSHWILCFKSVLFTFYVYKLYWLTYVSNK